MMNGIIDLTAERNRRDRPDPEHVRLDEDGVELFEFIFRYKMDGSRYMFTLFAYDWEDAESRAEAIRKGVVVDGQLHRVVPA